VCVCVVCVLFVCVCVCLHVSVSCLPTCVCERVCVREGMCVCVVCGVHVCVCVCLHVNVYVHVNVCVRREDSEIDTKIESESRMR